MAGGGGGMAPTISPENAIAIVDLKTLIVRPYLLIEPNNN
jgi:hypothetical protein